jgi:formylglycine-generating enzyme required for sulfatase activity
MPSITGSARARVALVSILGGLVTMQGVGCGAPGGTAQSDAVLGQACPPGFECVPQPAPLLANGITAWCESATERAVYVPAGNFWFGCNRLKQQECPNWYPAPYQVEITTGSYAILRAPVTIGDYEECAQATHPGCETRMGEGSLYALALWDTVAWFRQIAAEVNRSEAQAYCEWWGRQTGAPWRLCSESEWEKANLGGCETLTAHMDAFGLSCAEAVRKYPWGDEPTECALQWYNQCANEPPWAPDPVGVRPMAASPYGVTDTLTQQHPQWVEDCAGGTAIPRIPRDGTAWGGECTEYLLRGYQQEESDSITTGRYSQYPKSGIGGIICCRDM